MGFIGLCPRIFIMFMKNINISCPSVKKIFGYADVINFVINENELVEKSNISAAEFHTYGQNASLSVRLFICIIYTFLQLQAY